MAATLPQVLIIKGPQRAEIIATIVSAGRLVAILVMMETHQIDSLQREEELIHWYF